MVRCSCDAPGQVSLTATLDSPRIRTRLHHAPQVPLYCRAKGRRMWNRNITRWITRSSMIRKVKDSAFAICLQAVLEGGHATADADGVHIEGANAVTLVLAAHTSYAGFDGSLRQVALDPVAAGGCKRRFGRVASIRQPREAHVSDHARLFDRVALDLGRSTYEEQPTDERIRAWQQSDDPALVACSSSTVATC